MLTKEISATNEYIASLKIMESQCHDKLTIHYLEAGRTTDLGIISFAIAMEQGLLAVTEVGGGDVPSLKFTSSSQSKILITEGTTIEGLKQSRFCRVFVLINPMETQVDCIIVFRLDRWGRSLKHLINSLSELQSLGVSFVFYSENIDLSTPAGKMMFHVIGAMAEFERSLIIERVKAGMVIAKLKGQQIGRTPTPPYIIKKVIEVFDSEKLSVRDISKKTDTPKSTVAKILTDYKSGAITKEGMPVRVS